MLIKRIIFYLKTKSLIKSKMIYGIGSFFYVLFFYISPYLSGKFRDIKLLTKMNDGKKYVCSLKDIEVLYDLYELEMEEIFNIKKGDIVFDIGSHIGVYGIKVSGLAKEIYAFEPLSKTFKFLTKNIELNKITNIRPLNFAISKDSGYKDLYSFNASSGMSSLILSKDMAELDLNIEKTRVVRLDDIAKELRIKKLDVIKIDTEGSELDILDGGIETIKKFKPLLIIECHCWMYSYDSLKSKLEGLNYKIMKEKIHPLNTRCIIIIAKNEKT